MEGLDTCMALMVHGRTREDALLIHPFPDWIESCAVSTLLRARNSVSWADIVGDQNADDVRANKLVQSCAYGVLLRRNCPFDLTAAIKHRFILRNWVCERDAGFYAHKAKLLLSTIHNLVPPCVMFAMYNTLFNGWTTSARFQAVDKVCWLCFNCNGHDCIEHYGSCMYQWRVFASKCKKSIFPCSLLRFLGLFAEHTNDMVLHACHVYAVRSAVHLRLREQIISDEQAVSSLIWQGHRTAALQHRNLRKRYSEIWNIEF